MSDYLTPATPRGEKEERNARVQKRWDELWREGKHGHYETLFRVVREEVERAERETITANAAARDANAAAKRLERERDEALTLLREARDAMLPTLGVFMGTCVWHGPIKESLARIDEMVKT